MFLPIGDEPNPRKPAVVNWLLIGLNIAVFAFVSAPLMYQQVDLRDPLLPEYLHLLSRHAPHLSLDEILAHTTAYDLFTFRWGFRPADANLVDLLTSMFLHGGWLHLIGNLLFLYIFGDNVEARLGRLGYLASYLGFGAASTLFFMLFQEDVETPLVGASGAISGVLGCYFVWFPKNRVRVLMVLVWFIDVWRVPARIVLGVYLVLDNLLPFLAGGGGGVAHGAHIGGFLAGLTLAFASGVLGRSREASEGGGVVEVERFDQVFGRAVARQDFDRAADLYAQMSLPERNRLRDEDVLTLASGLIERGRAEVALAILQRFIATRPLSPALPVAHLRAGLVLLGSRGQLEAARQHFLSVLDAEPAPELALAARQGLAAVEEKWRSRLD